MSIERTSPLNPVASLHHRESGDPAALPNRSSQSASAASAEVQLSGAQARLMQPGPADINQARVEALKAGIRSGEVKMDTGKIADALLQDIHQSLQDN